MSQVTNDEEFRELLEELTRGSTCSLCATPRDDDDLLCVSCGSVFVDHATGRCQQHGLALPPDSECPGCGEEAPPLAS